MHKIPWILFDKQIRSKDIIMVGGKNANLGEMINRTSVPVPRFFAITSEAYRHFLRKNGLEPHIRTILSKTKIRSVRELSAAGKDIRSLVKGAKMPEDLESEILNAFDKLGDQRVAVRSSATAEDLPRASFAGQQESFLNVSRSNIIDKIISCFASLWTDRAISYREDHNFDHFKVWLSVGVQRMVHSKASGVLFTIDPDSGHPGFVFINGSWGLGDFIVQGRVSPDQFYVHKPTMSIVSKKLGEKRVMEIRTFNGVTSKPVPKKFQKTFVLNDAEILQLSRHALAIEHHYGHAQDIEWAKDLRDNRVYIVQSRPETVHAQKNHAVLREWKLLEKGKSLAHGLSIGRAIASGTADVIKTAKDIEKFKAGQILVTVQTDPDWEPIMKIASGIVTEVGGKTSHAAIVSRELGVPTIVGVENATRVLKTGQKVTLDCTMEIGHILRGELRRKAYDHRVSDIPKAKTKIYVNLANPEAAFDVSQLPVDGVGLARQEFIINDYIGEHPLAMLKQGRSQEYVERLAEGIAKIASSFYPRLVIVRLSDFKTDEYRSLEGGKLYEITEANPMIGWRGASRYIHPKFKEAFKLECCALKKVRDEMKLTNVIIMVPFCRTVSEGKEVLRIMKKNGLRRGKNGLKIYVMAEIPSNIILAEEFAKLFDGFSIGSNDLTQLTLGIDRNSALIASAFDERNDAIKKSIVRLIKASHKTGKPVGICGEAPSNYPDFVRFLVGSGIDSISVEPDAAIRTRFTVARAEKNLQK